MKMLTEGQVGRRQGLKSKMGKTRAVWGRKEEDTYPAWMAALRTQCWWQGAPC